MCLSLDKHCNGVNNFVNGTDEEDSDQQINDQVIRSDQIFFAYVLTDVRYFMCDNTWFPRSNELQWKVSLLNFPFFSQSENRTDCYDEKNCNSTSKMYLFSIQTSVEFVQFSCFLVHASALSVMAVRITVPQNSLAN